MSKISAFFAGRFVAGLVLCVAFGLAVPALAALIDLSPNAAVKPAPLMQPADVYRMTRTSIARVLVTYQVEDGTEGSENSETKAAEGTRSKAAGGTSFIVDDLGDLATNCHVVDAPNAIGPVKVEIQFSDDPTWLAAKVLGCDRAGDIAVIHVDGLSPNRRPLHFAKPGTFGPGDEVMAVGYSLGLDGDPSASRGIVSALHRSLLGQFGDLVQTDAVINHGNSGGPLLDMRGEVIGVNTYTEPSHLMITDVELAQKQNAIDAGSASVIDFNLVQGISYARSAATAEVYVQKIIATGRVARSTLGIVIAPVDPIRFHLPRQGVVIQSVAPSSPAARAGLTKGKVIYAIDLGNGVNWQTRTPGDLADALALMTPGRVVKLQCFSLTDNGIDLANEGKSIPVSELKWYNVDVVPVADTASSSLISVN
jgi:serine protease Do